MSGPRDYPPAGPPEPPPGEGQPTRVPPGPPPGYPPVPPPVYPPPDAGPPGTALPTEPGYPPPAYDPPPPAHARPNLVLAVAVVGGILLVATALLVWLRFEIGGGDTITLNGLGQVGGPEPLASSLEEDSPNAIFAPLLGLVIVGVALAAIFTNSRRLITVALVAAALALAYALFRWSTFTRDARDFTDDTGLPAGVGIGVWVAMAGAAIAVVGAAAGLIRARRT